MSIDARLNCQRNTNDSSPQVGISFSLLDPAWACVTQVEVKGVSSSQVVSSRWHIQEVKHESWGQILGSECDSGR